MSVLQCHEHMRMCRSYSPQLSVTRELNVITPKRLDKILGAKVPKISILISMYIDRYFLTTR
jgi:hypothetical protein